MCHKNANRETYQPDTSHSVAKTHAYPGVKTCDPSCQKLQQKNTTQIYHQKKNIFPLKPPFKGKLLPKSSLSSTGLQHHRQRRDTAERWDRSFACWWPKSCPTPSCWWPWIFRQKRLVKRWHHHFLQASHDINNEVLVGVKMGPTCFMLILLWPVK